MTTTNAETGGNGRLRVAIVAGTLGQGGAEKQLVYIARSLRDAGVDLRIYCATRGEHHEGTLAGLGIQPVWFGQSANPALRLVRLAFELRRFRPHIVQSLHFYASDV